MKLWVDDIRPAPDDTWVWARTNDVARSILTIARNSAGTEVENLMTEVSLDHDMGLHDLDPNSDSELCTSCMKPAPEGLEWCQTPQCNTDLRDSNNRVPADMIQNYRGFDADNGLKLVEWMIENNVVPPKVTIHSWNVPGAKRMYSLLNQHGYDCEYAAYTP